jgi:hypothetical protein
MAGSTSDFSARPSALGYFYQVRYALLLLLQSDADAALSLEKLDDVAFEKDGSAQDLLQFKHHIGHTASLSDSSSDLWKTLRVWCEGLRSQTYDPKEARLLLVTTAVANPGSIAEKLKPGGQRDVEGALVTLEAVANTSKSDSNTSAYSSFLALTPAQRRQLVDHITVLDSALHIDGIGLEIERYLRPAASEKHLKSFCTRIEGWWFTRVIVHWTSDILGAISHRELQSELDELREQFHRNSLPADFPTRLTVSEDDLLSDERLFVEQLRKLNVGRERINDAVSDYLRAFRQRSLWVREELVWQGELEQYNDRLVDEWRNLFYAAKDDFKNLPTVLRTSKGRALYTAIIAQLILIRPGFTHPYVMRGSYHMLANIPRVCWHLDYEAKLVSNQTEPEKEHV